MTIDEAISHALEVAESCEWQALQCDVTDAYENHVKGENEQCAADHRQLAEWLTELKEARTELDRLYPILENARILSNAVFEFKEKFFDKHLNK